MRQGETRREKLTRFARIVPLFVSTSLNKYQFVSTKTCIYDIYIYMYILYLSIYDPVFSLSAHPRQGMVAPSVSSLSAPPPPPDKVWWRRQSPVSAPPPQTRYGLAGSAWDCSGSPPGAPGASRTQWEPSGRSRGIPDGSGSPPGAPGASRTAVGGNGPHGRSWGPLNCNGQAMVGSQSPSSELDVDDFTKIITSSYCCYCYYY